MDNEAQEIAEASSQKENADGMRTVSPTKRHDLPRGVGLHHASRASDSCVDDTRLLRSIQALDEDLSVATTSAKQVCQAFRFFLELLLQWKYSSADSSALLRAELEIIWEARVLGCLQRFVTKKKHVDTTFVGCCSSGSACVQRLVCYALVTIIYSLARDPRLASSVVKHELYALLFELQDVSGSSTDSNKDTPEDQDQLEFSDARDLLLSLDPFDWCLQPTCIQIATVEHEQQMETKSDAAFLIPIGARSLIYLLAGEALPVDEITEYDTKMRLYPDQRGQFLSPTKKSRRLPSIFTFPMSSDSTSSSADVGQPIKGSVCSRKGDPALQMARSHAALQHMALRATVVLLQNLRRPSPERKLLLHDGECVRMLTAATQVHHSNSLPDPICTKLLDGGKVSGLLVCQMVAIEPSTLARIAQCGLSLLHADELHSPTEKRPPLRRQQSNHHAQAPPVCSSSSQVSSSMRSTPKTQKRHAVGGVGTLSLAGRLQAASEEGRQEIAAEEWCSSSLLKREIKLERSLRRQQLRSQCVSLEQLRGQLGESLLLLHTGRTHADPTQSFTSWIASLPTIEKNEQERQRTDLMRQQHAIEVQFQREEARKQRLRECTMMQQNDSDALSETEHDRREQKRLEFLRMHDEMRVLQEQQQREDQRMGGDGDTMLLEIGAQGHDDQQVSEIQARMLHAETLAAQRKARQKTLDDEQTRLRWVHQRKQESKELERMAREDLYYVEKLLHAKQLEEERRKQQQLSAKQTGDLMAVQQRKIERMWQLDLERKLAEKESERMRTEDLVARQLQFVDADCRRLEAQQERLARRHMEIQERDCRALWMRIEQEQKRLDEIEAKRLRVEARKQLKLQNQYEAQVLAAWAESWDEYGSVYYYNTLTGVSQWESPFGTTTQ